MLWIWIGFVSLIVFFLALDLGVFHKEDKEVSVREAFTWTGVWVTVALLFSVFVYFAYDRHLLGLGMSVDPVDRLVNDGRLALVKYLTGYVIEWSLSVDNVFVIAMIFGFLRIPAEYQHRVLFWGILGALVMRGVMIFVGAELVERYHWILYLFGIFLIFTAFRMAFSKSDHEDPGQGFVLRTVRRLFPVSAQYHGNSFLAMEHGKRVLTPLAVALVLVETTDVIFAVDSIPAIFAITGDPFLVATSNAFAILGLRSLYFALAGAITAFAYLQYSLAAILALVGGKMLAASWLKARFGENVNFYLLGLVGLFLAIGVGASIWKKRRDERLGIEDPVSSHLGELSPEEVVPPGLGKG